MRPNLAVKPNETKTAAGKSEPKTPANPSQNVSTAPSKKCSKANHACTTVDKETQRAKNPEKVTPRQFKVIQLFYFKKR
jgi:hypothetical protein